MGDAARSQQRLTYVTDLDRAPAGGGAYAVNWHAFDELGKRFDAHYAGPVVPKPPMVEDFVSKVRRRIFKRPGRYVYFSPDTLEENARRALSLVAEGSDAIVFRSAARWCRCRPDVPYFIYLDAVIHTFFYNTFDENDFEMQDLERIWRDEAEFLEGAAGVFFESRWGLEKAREAYRLTGNHYHTVGRGTAIDPPAADMWDGDSHRLITIAMNFRQKGGDVVADAFRMLKPRFPSLTWHIIGGKPDFAPESIDGVTYEGILRPDTDATRLNAIFAKAFLCIHPTREDTSPLVITEAAYFGCPSISVNAFAIPELVLDGQTGILLDPPPDATSVARAIESLLIDQERYLAMRIAAREHAMTNFRWSRTGAAMCDAIQHVLEP